MRRFSTILSLLLITVVTCLAQLKITPNGNMYVQRDSVTGQASLSVGSLPGMTGRYYDTWKMGIRSNVYNNTLSGNAIGVFGEASLQNTYGGYFTAGVWGISSGAYLDSDRGMSYGVLGTLHTGALGAAIYGANCDDAFYGIGGSLAGYFYGPVHIAGAVYSTVGFNSPSDMRLKKDVVMVKDTEKSNGSTLANLMSLDVLNYRLEFPERKRALTEGTDVSDDPNAKYVSMRHFGVSAQELQKIFPDLVHENEEGYLTINYVELVPLLIRSLQEMNLKIEYLENKTSNRTSFATSVNEAKRNRNVLYQNTPNPFKEQTVIRFCLADGVNDAAICIFDMTGKTIKKLPISSGDEQVTVNSYELGEGMFLYSLIVNGQEIDTKKMLISK